MNGPSEMPGLASLLHWPFGSLHSIYQPFPKASSHLHSESQSNLWLAEKRSRTSNFLLSEWHGSCTLQLLLHSREFNRGNIGRLCGVVAHRWLCAQLTEEEDFGGQTSFWHKVSQVLNLEGFRNPLSHLHTLISYPIFPELVTSYPPGQPETREIKWRFLLPYSPLPVTYIS